MKRIALLGDSIFDNEVYVEKKRSVKNMMTRILGKHGIVDLLAIDGSVTDQVVFQIPRLHSETDHIFVSSGGNDALRVKYLMFEAEETDENDLNLPGIMAILRDFRASYRNLMLKLKNWSCPVTICTIYDSVPGLSAKEKVALSLFNSIIIEEAIKFGYSILDLRSICNDFGDYSSISPIEPSESGGKKIAEAICRMAFKRSGLKENRIFA